jgi:hypothetical protein
VAVVRVVVVLLTLILAMVAAPPKAMADSTITWYIDSVFPSTGRGAGQLTFKCAALSDATWSYPFKHPIAQKTSQKDIGPHGEVVQVQVSLLVDPTAVKSIGCYVTFFFTDVGILDGIGSGTYYPIIPLQVFRAKLKWIGRPRT